MTAKLYEVVSLVLSCDPAELSEATSPETLKSWDSVAQILLVAAVEQEFGAEFSDEEALKIRCLGDIVALLKAKGVAV